MPVVFFDRVVPDIDTHKVVVDNYRGAFDATRHLLESGYRRIAAVTNSETLSITQDRMAGYRAALAEEGIAEEPGYIRSCPHGGLVLAEVNTAVEGLLAMETKPDAILALSDKLTTGCLRILKNKGLQVPRDMGLIGFSNSDLTELIDPPLSIIKQPALEMGEVAMNSLLQLLNSKQPVTEFNTHKLAPQLIIRTSSVRA